MSLMSENQKRAMIKSAPSANNLGGEFGGSDFSNPETPYLYKGFFRLVRSGGLEPPLLLQNSDLNAARLPIPPRPQIMSGSGADIDDGLRDAKGKTC